MKILIAGTNSGVGKTTVSLLIMRALRNMNYKVSPFKVGPDFVDPNFHSFATGSTSYNLDYWLMNEKDIIYTFNKKHSGCSVVEGVMGLFDGRVNTFMEASSAHVANILKLNIILVVDGSGISQSINAIIKGFNEYSEETKISGVIINKVSSRTHYLFLKKMIESTLNIKCFGYIKKDIGIVFKSRYLGLVEEFDEALDSKLDELSEDIKESIDIEGLLNLEEKNIKSENKDYGKNYNKKVGVFQSNCFSFYYKQNLEILKSKGITLVDIDPLKDKDLKQVDALYIGGGFPELYIDELQKNKSFISDLKTKLENGLHCYCEGGGFLYLSNSINKRKMVGFYECDILIGDKLKRFGYTKLKYLDFSINTHEFHYSYVEDETNLNPIFKVSKNNREWADGFKKKNTIANYSHIHFLSNIELLDLFLDRL